MVVIKDKFIGATSVTSKAIGQGTFVKVPTNVIDVVTMHMVKDSLFKSNKDTTLTTVSLKIIKGMEKLHL